MKISKSLIRHELSKRQLRKELVLHPDFTTQNAFINDPSRYIAARCSRRAGKTNGLAFRFFRTLDKHPKSQCLYIALTRESAYSILWPVLLELNDDFNLGCTFLESKLTMVWPNGAKLRLLGADQKNFIKRLKGIKTPGIGIDEAQDFGAHLQNLIDDVLAPTMTDYEDSWLALTGTAGLVPSGYFFEVTHERKFGYSVHEWTVLENPYLPNAEQFIKEYAAKREWKADHPTLLREWRNQWVLDVESLWIRYKISTCDYTTLPNQKYTYIMGIDLGFKDADAIAVLAWSETDPTTYLVEECINSKQGLTELVNQIEYLAKKYDVSKMVIDEGGLGKKLAEEMRRQHKIPVQPADKARKQETVEFLNDALRLGRFKAKSGSRFAQDTLIVQIDWDKTTPNKIVIKKKPHSDIIDAVIYGFKESPAYTYEIPKQKPKNKTKEWYDQQVSDMEEKAMEYFSQLEENQKKGDDYL